MTVAANRVKQAACAHRSSNPHGCLDCGAPWCAACLAHHAGTGRRGPHGWEEQDPWPCVARMRKHLAAFEMFLAEVRRHTNGMCPCITSADCSEAIDDAVDRIDAAIAATERRGDTK